MPSTLSSTSSRATGDFGWWHAVQNPLPRRAGTPASTQGNDTTEAGLETRDFSLRSSLSKDRSDGVFGFSQGAALTVFSSAFASRAGKTHAGSPVKFDFAVMLGRFPQHDRAIGQTMTQKESTLALAPHRRTLALHRFLATNRSTRLRVSNADILGTTVVTSSRARRTPVLVIGAFSRTCSECARRSRRATARQMRPPSHSGVAMEVATLVGAASIRR